MNTPANSASAIREMEAGLAAMEDALKNHNLHPSAEFMQGVDGGQKAYDLLSDAIKDVKAALVYAQSGILCPECMMVSSANSRFCQNCGLEFGA